ncbi:MAG: alpha/beta hydrolase-fold protein [Nocardioidaceae bacterium]|nr:alpha/beta hydrolase-fold protein [Nocardioidaceae bacterium]
MHPWPTPLAGRLDEREIDSVLLRDNPLGDPSVRPLWVQVPPGYDDSDRRYPTVYLLQGYTGHVDMWHNRRPYRRTTPEAVDALQGDPDVPGFVAVYVDAWTLYGGSQFVDSPGTGAYHSYLCDEVVPWVDAHYRTLADRDHRAVTGKSSGGFGAMITPMLRPDLFGALATHAGDALYEYLYLPEFARCVRALRAHDGDVWAWWRDFSGRVAGTDPADDVLLMELGVAACFSADDDGTVRLPFDTRTGVLDEARWQRWLAWDPVRMLHRPDHAEAMRSLRGAWVDGGTRDEWFLDVGAQAFADGLLDVGLPPDRLAFEHFEAGHGGIEHRYPLAISWLAGRIAP